MQGGRPGQAHGWILPSRHTHTTYRLAHKSDHGLNEQQACVCACMCVCVLLGWGGLLTPRLRVEAWFIRLQMRCNRTGESEQLAGWLFVYLLSFCFFCFFFKPPAPPSILAPPCREGAGPGWKIINSNKTNLANRQKCSIKYCGSSNGYQMIPQ